VTRDDEVDLGEPIRLLADLEEPAPSRLRARVRNSIRRRHLAGDLLDFSVFAPGKVLLTYVTGLFEALMGGPSATIDRSSPASGPPPTPQDES
jgi:hypothetical protein